MWLLVAHKLRRDAQGRDVGSEDSYKLRKREISIAKKEKNISKK